MAMIKVLYVDKTSGTVEDSLLDDLIAKGEIAAFCSSHGWVEVRSVRIPGLAEKQSDSKERSQEPFKGRLFKMD